MSKQAKPQVQTTQTTVDPWTQAQWDALNKSAADLADNRMANYGPDQRIAGLTDAEIAAGAGYTNFLDPNNANSPLAALQGFQGLQAPQVNAATGTVTQAGMGATYDKLLASDPVSVAAANARAANRGEVRDVTGQQGSDFMSSYMNPYTDQVVAATMADLQNAREQQGVADAAAASRAGAFGGDRYGVVQAQTTNDYLRNVASTVAGLRSQGFTTAANLGMTDASRMLEAAGMNQGADVSVAGLAQQARIANASNATQANIAAANLQSQRDLAMLNAEYGMGQFNAGQANSMSQFNVGQENTVGLANAANTIAAANVGVGAASAGANATLAGLAGQTAWGGMQRGVEQARRDFAYNQPMDLLSWRAQILGGTPSGSTSTTTIPQEKNIGAGVLGGAMAGATFGPWGAVGGALLGGLGSLF